MKLIIELDDNNYCDKDDLADAVANGTPYNPTGDCISREALKDAIENQDKFACLPDTTLVPFRMLNEPEKNYEPYVHLRDIRNAIDNAPTVPQINIFCENADETAIEDMKAELQNVLVSGRPKGECVDISKLRLMTVEECAGHTIDYAMGWKAYIKWIKKGGAE